MKLELFKNIYRIYKDEQISTWIVVAEKMFGSSKDSFSRYVIPKPPIKGFYYILLLIDENGGVTKNLKYKFCSVSPTSYLNDLRIVLQNSFSIACTDHYVLVPEDYGKTWLITDNCKLIRYD